MEFYNPDRKKLTDEDAYIVRCVVIHYGGYESWKLSGLTHNEISWTNSRRGLKPSEDGDTQLTIEDIIVDSNKIRPYDSLYDMYYNEFEDAVVI